VNFFILYFPRNWGFFIW